MSRMDYARTHNTLGLCRNCTKPLVDGSKVYCEYHREKSRAYGREKEKRLAIKLKKEILAQYGNVCKCCGESNSRFLTLNHEHGKGNIHRKALFKFNVGGVHIYRWLKNNQYPDGYTVLCMNCNWATRFGNVCPHQE